MSPTGQSAPTSIRIFSGRRIVTGGVPVLSIPWLQSHSIRYREPSIPNDRAT